ncbi:hypothetical protein [Kribbella endophytica]
MPIPNHDPNDYRGNWPGPLGDDDRQVRARILLASQKLANFGVTSWPVFDPEDGTYCGLIAVDPDQLFDLLNDLDLRALEA